MIPNEFADVRSSSDGHKYMLDADEVSSILCISKGDAYKKIRILNAELREKGYIVIPGKIPYAYMKTRLYGFE